MWCRQVRWGMVESGGSSVGCVWAGPWAIRWGLATAACRRGSGEDCEQVRGEVRRQVRGLWGGKDRGQIVGCGVGRTAGKRLLCRPWAGCAVIAGRWPQRSHRRHGGCAPRRARRPGSEHRRTARRRRNGRERLPRDQREGSHRRSRPNPSHSSAVVNSAQFDQWRAKGTGR